MMMRSEQEKDMPQSYMVTGRLSRDPEVRTSKAGKAVCKLSIPTDDGWGERKKTTWHNIVCFGKTAEIVAQYKKKGDWVCVQGRLEIDEWEDKDGNKRRTPQLIANSVEFVGNKAEGYKADDSYGTQQGESEIPF
jgi:single-strand DNA-binding protein